MASSGKKTKGKQKIEIKIIKNEDDRLISFSKRRTRIYKKSLSSPLYVVVRFFLLFSYQLVNLIRLVIRLLNLSLNAF
ncbi:hypothetical protein Goklo_010949 [Gossypium klotzschianum]|uniref:MADS-box domain-containing protein n=1 Tax=Gossypium klotzschianum TaxID=34286 RepID=A0A7J8V7K6_9ROSI|nr:hypothetical protein [Gossypium klotzschianum]